MKHIKLIILAIISVVCFSAYAGNLVRLDSSWSGDLRPAGIMDKYKVYCNSSGVVTGLYMPAETYLTYGVSGVSIVSELDGASGVTGTHTFNSALTYSGANLISAGCPVLQ